MELMESIVFQMESVGLAQLRKSISYKVTA